MQYVSFSHRVAVYPADDYDRRGPWMHAAVDRMRFRRKIEQTELILAPVLLSHHQTCCRLSNFFADTAYFLLNQPILLTDRIFADTTYFCWVITRNFADSSKFADTSFLLNQLIFPESANFCLLSISYQAFFLTQQVFTDTAYFCRMSWFLLRLHFFTYQASFVESSLCILLTQKVLLTAYFAKWAHFADSSNFCWAYFCWVITRDFCGLIKFCWHSIFCWISWSLLRRQILLTQHLLLSPHQAFLLTQQVFADKENFLLNQLIFADS